MTIIREMLLTSSYDFTHHTEKKVLTIDRKNCLPSSEKTAYRGQKKVLTADRKNSLPNDGKIILPRAEKDMDRLRRWLRLAARTDSVDAFEKAMMEV